MVPLFALNANAVIVDTNTPDFDYNQDGKINLNDARAILRVSAGIDDEIEGMIYDFDNNGFVDYYDVNTVLRVVSGIDSDIAVTNEYLLSLFKKELNSVKSVHPGFKKVATSDVQSALVTTENSPEPSLNVTNLEFKDYVAKIVNYSSGFDALLPDDIKKDLQEMQEEAILLYEPQTETTEVAKTSPVHYTEFPVGKLGYSCFLEMSDIASISSYEQNGYIIREVIMNEDTYVGDEYPTGSSGFKDRWQTISYGKVFNIPSFDETDGSTLNKVTFKNGKIISKVDKLTGMPVEIRYEFTYISDISAAQQTNTDGSPGLKMRTVTTKDHIEIYTINPVEANSNG